MLCPEVSSPVFMQGWNDGAYGQPLGKPGDGYLGAHSIPFAMRAAFVKCVITEN